MSIDPDLRIALGFILMLRVGVGIFYSGLAGTEGILAEIRGVEAEHPGPRRLVWGLLIVPLLPFFFDEYGLAWILYELNSTVAEFSIIGLFDSLRLFLLLPAVVGLLILLWSYHSAVSPRELRAEDSPSLRYVSGAFRGMRFPQWLGDLILFGSLNVATDNWFAVIAFAAACWILCSSYLPLAEQAWQRMLGEDYPAYASRTGRLLPRAPTDKLGHAVSYAVPRRFGLSAILGFLTLFACMFGGINLLQYWMPEIQLTPTLHIFFGLQLMVIWICQMRFGTAPRRASALVGAVLLPAFVFFNLDTIPNHAGLIAGVLFVLGGIIGYCVGAVAAGLFLFMAWLGPHFPGTRSPQLASSTKSTDPPVS